MKDSTDRLLEALEHPERFSDDELDTLLSDSETQQFYDLMSKTSDALTPTAEPDIDREWNRFVTSHNKPKAGFFSVLFSRHAAAAVITLVGSLAVVATTIGIKRSVDKNHELKQTTVVKEQQVVNSTINGGVLNSDSVSASILTVQEVVIFKNETLKQILDTIGQYYGITVLFTTPEKENLHLYFKWEQTQSLPNVVDQLNSFSQINIVLNDGVLTVE